MLTSATDRPWPASSAASARPAGPAPTMATSAVSAAGSKGGSASASAGCSGSIFVACCSTRAASYAPSRLRWLVSTVARVGAASTVAAAVRVGGAARRPCWRRTLAAPLLLVPLVARLGPLGRAGAEAAAEPHPWAPTCCIGTLYWLPGSPIDAGRLLPRCGEGLCSQKIETRAPPAACRSPVRRSHCRRHPDGKQRPTHRDGPAVRWHSSPQMQGLLRPGLPARSTHISRSQGLVQPTRLRQPRQCCHNSPQPGHAAAAAPTPPARPWCRPGADVQRCKRSGRRRRGRRCRRPPPSSRRCCSACAPRPSRVPCPPRWPWPPSPPHPWRRGHSQ